MTSTTLDCAEIRSGFTEGGVPAGPDVDAHLARCPHCRELFARGAELGRRLALSVLPAPEAGDLFAQVDRELGTEVGLRAALRAWPTRRRVAVVGGLGLLLVVWHLAMDPRVELGAEYPPSMLWGLLAVMCAAFLLGSRWLLRGASAPGSAKRGRLIALGLLIVPALSMLLAPLGASPEARAAWESPGVCFTYGSVLALPLLVVYWLFERRDRVPLPALLAAGALAGLAANALLHVHCASAHWGHLLLGHASIGVAWATVVALVAKPLERPLRPGQKQ
jgi:hypothetical protein